MTSGREANTPTERNHGRRVVLDLVAPYFGTHRGITGDNFFTSLDLVEELLRRGLTYIGNS